MSTDLRNHALGPLIKEMQDFLEGKRSERTPLVQSNVAGSVDRIAQVDELQSNLTSPNSSLVLPKGNAIIPRIESLENRENLKTDFIDSDELIPWKSQIEVTDSIYSHSIILMYVGISRVFDRKSTQDYFLKFKSGSHKYIWNGVFEGKESRWYKKRADSCLYEKECGIKYIKLL